MAADDCLASLLPQQPAAVCLALLKANLPAQGTVNTPACQPTALIQVGHMHDLPGCITLYSCSALCVLGKVTWPWCQHFPFDLVSST